MSDLLALDRRRFLTTTAGALATSRVGGIGAMLHQAACAAAGSPGGPEMPSLERATGWVNSAPLTSAGLRGQVVLVQFCTFSCINWLRTLPHVRAWSDGYGGHGLTVLGVHSPEFTFEQDDVGVRRALRALRVAYPVAIDSDLGVWNAFGNAYWPALYLVDARGRIRHRHFGEGEYARTERMIQQLLTERGASPVGPDLVTVDARGIEADAAWGDLRSPENYLGYTRTAHFASPGGVRRDERRTYAAPARLARNQWALAGDWTMGAEATVVEGARGRIACDFHARDLHLVMGPAAPGASVPFQVLIDGRAPEGAHGLDVDAQGFGSLSEHRLHQLVRQPGPIDDRRFEIVFPSAGAEAFSFTFG